MISKSALKNASRKFKVLSDETRLSILFLLSKQPLNVSSIAENLHIEQSNLSHHLKILKDHRLVKVQRIGKFNEYSLDDHHVFAIIEQMFEHVEENIND